MMDLVYNYTNTVATNHMWLLIFKLIELKSYFLSCSSHISSVRESQRRVVAAILHSADIKHFHHHRKSTEQSSR